MTYVTGNPLDYDDTIALGAALADLHGAAFVASERLRRLGVAPSTLQTLVQDVTRHAVIVSGNTKAAGK